MILWVDCKGALDLTYCWNVSGLTKHVLLLFYGHPIRKQVIGNRNMSKSKGWTLQSYLLMLWMDENSN